LPLSIHAIRAIRLANRDLWPTLRYTSGWLAEGVLVDSDHFIVREQTERKFIHAVEIMAQQ
jgi:hypothetical protein